MSWLWVAPAVIVAGGSVVLVITLRRLTATAGELRRELGRLGELRHRVSAVRADADEIATAIAQLRERGLPQLRR